MRLEWSPDAKDDLDKIWEYIAQDSVDRAFQFVNELMNEAQKLKDTPMMGIMIPELNNVNDRELFYKNYTIIYEIMDDRIIIHEVHNQSKYYIRSIKR